MGKTKKILMWTSAILMIVSGIISFALCMVVITKTSIISDWTAEIIGKDIQRYDSVRKLLNMVVSFFTGGSVVGVVFGVISLKFCQYNSIEFYQKKSVVLTVAIVCALLVNPVVGILYIVAVLIKDENLKENLMKENNIDQDDFDVIMQKLERLKEMKENNIITEEEFEKLKSDIVNKEN